MFFLSNLHNSVHVMEFLATRYYCEGKFRSFFAELLNDSFVLGSPEECFGQLSSCWQEVGVNRLVISTHWEGMPLASALHST